VNGDVILHVHLKLLQVVKEAILLYKNAKQDAAYDNWLHKKDPQNFPLE